MEQFDIPAHEPLPAYAFPGGYDIRYIDREGNIFCAECAEKVRAEEGLKVTGYIHWEGQPEWCDECNAELPSEYGDPEEEPDDAS